jgi:hypothetical protein
LRRIQLDAELLDVAQKQLEQPVRIDLLAHGW